MVNVVDLNQDRIATWNSAHLPIHESGLPKIVRIARDGTSSSTIDLPGLGTVRILKRTPNLTFSMRVPESIAEADIVFICVNTPTKLYGLGAGATADISILESADCTIAKNAKDGAIIVEKSTVPCGTAHMIRDIVRFSFAHFPSRVAACSPLCVLLVSSMPLAKAGHGQRDISGGLRCVESHSCTLSHLNILKRERKLPKYLADTDTHLVNSSTFTAPTPSSRFSTTLSSSRKVVLLIT